jgi:hypothetical protein
MFDAQSNTALNPFIFTYKTPFMQRISDFVRTGHTQYIMGTISVSKAGLFAQKFEKKFQTGRTNVETCRARQQGEHSARLLFLHQDSTPNLTWILLYFPGATPDQSGQKWRNALKDRINITGYELVRHTRQKSKKPAWTWRYEETRYIGLRDSILMAIRKTHELELNKLIHTLVRSPGFAAVRAQVKKLLTLLQSEWKRRHAKTDTMPEIPKHGYTRRLKDKGCFLLELKEISKA